MYAVSSMQHDSRFTANLMIIYKLHIIVKIDDGKKSIKIFINSLDKR